MITNNTITARFAADRHATIAWKQQLSADLNVIVAAYGAADKPADTIAAAAAEIGIDRVRAIIATLTAYRVAMYDRRISDDTAAWAQTIADALDADAAQRVGLISDAIHPAHLDQLARAAAEYVEPETAEADAETTETAAEPAERAEKENTMKYIDTTKTPAVEVETTKRSAEIADALDDIRRERVAYGYGYRTKQRVTARCIREAERAGRPTVRVGYCDLYGVLSGIDPDYYTAGVYGWNCDVYVIAGLAICTGYRPAAGVRAVGVRELAEACRGADTATRDRLFAAWIVTNRERAREGARA